MIPPRKEGLNNNSCTPTTSATCSSIESPILNAPLSAVASGSCGAAARSAAGRGAVLLAVDDAHPTSSSGCSTTPAVAAASNGIIIGGIEAATAQPIPTKGFYSIPTAAPAGGAPANGPSAAPYVLTAAGGTPGAPLGDHIATSSAVTPGLFEEHLRRQVLLAAARKQQQQRHHRELLRFRQHEKQYMLAALRNDLNRYSAPSFIDIATLRKLQQNSIFAGGTPSAVQHRAKRDFLIAEDTTRTNNDRFGEAGADSSGLTDQDASRGWSSAEWSNKTDDKLVVENKDDTAGVSPNISNHDIKATSNDPSIMATFSPEEDSSQHGRDSSSSSPARICSKRKHSNDAGGVSSTPAASADAKSLSSKRAKKSAADPVFEQAWKNLMSETCNNWSSNEALFSMVERPTTDSSSSTTTGGSSIPLLGGPAFVKGIIDNDPNVMTLLFGKSDDAYADKVDMRKIILNFVETRKDGTIIKSANNPAPSNNMEDSEIGGLPTKERVPTTDDNGTDNQTAGKRKISSSSNPLVQWSMDDIDNFVQILATERKKIMVAAVRKSVQLAYIETINRSDAIASRSAGENIVFTEKSKDPSFSASPSTTTAGTSTSKNVSAEIEELKKEHASQIAAMQTEHETFISELIEQHEKEEENLQKDTESQMILHSRVMENYLLASSSALKVVRDKVAADFM